MNNPTQTYAPERIELPNGYYFKNLGQGFWGMFTPDNSRMGNNTLWTTSIAEHFAAAMQPVPSESDEAVAREAVRHFLVDLHGLDDIDPNNLPTHLEWHLDFESLAYVFAAAIAHHRNAAADAEALLHDLDVIISVSSVYSPSSHPQSADFGLIQDRALKVKQALATRAAVKETK